MDTLIEGSIDIYAEFGVAPDASEAEINRQYRKLALRFHPDKDSSAGAQAKFHLHQTIYSVLTQPELRRQYDDIVSSRNTASDADAAIRVAAFREKLKSQEGVAKAAAPSVPSVSALAQKGTMLRRMLQQQMQEPQGYIGTRELTVPSYMGEFLHKSVHVYWKQRPEADAYINAEVLAEMMAVFGQIAACETLGSADRYCKGVVKYQRAIDAEAAISHDYSKSSTLWRSTRVRKQASLLRRVEYLEEEVDSILGCV